MSRPEEDCRHGHEPERRGSLGVGKALAQHRHGAQVEGAAGRGLEGADAALAEDHLLVAAGHAFAQDSARQWLDEMSSALQTLDYDGTFVYLHDGRLVSILEDYVDKAPLEMFALYPTRSFMPVALKLFLQALSESCSSEQGSSASQTGLSISK